MTELPAPQVRFGGPTAIIVPPDNGFKGPPQGERAGQCRKGHPAPETLGCSDRREPESVIGGVGRKIGNLAGGPVTSGRVGR